jgi:hypothetical protein
VIFELQDPGQPGSYITQLTLKSGLVSLAAAPTLQLTGLVNALSDLAPEFLVSSPLLESKLDEAIKQRT